MSELSHSASSCPHLGLPDDRRTSLAYPSIWNHCYRTTQPASIDLAHQSELCLGSSFDECLVYKADEPASVPAELDGVLKIVRSKRRPPIKWMRPFLLVLLLAFAIGGIFIAWTFAGINRGVKNSVLPGSPASAAVPIVSRTMQPAAGGQATATHHSIVEPGATRTRMPVMKTASPATVCGHELDVPFGETTIFVLHRILRGENLTKFARQYQTTEQTIIDINYRLRIPVWAERVVVIPVGLENAGDLPLFEAYQPVGDEVSMDDLARELNADPLALRKYNDFPEQCSTYSGWLLIARAASTPSE